MTTIAPLQLLQTFRGKLLGIFPRRADALFELIDALLLTVDPRSPVELSRSPAFRRRFSMVYDAMQQGQIEPEQARQLLAEAEPAEALIIAGCALYGVDTTIDPRPDAETLPDRSQVYSTSQKKAIPGHQSSWLGRIVSQAPAWFAPRDLERVSSRDTPAGDFLTLEREWRQGDQVTLSLPLPLACQANDHVAALSRGPLVYAYFQNAQKDPVIFYGHNGRYPDDVTLEIAPDQLAGGVAEEPAPEGLLGPALRVPGRIEGQSPMFAAGRGNGEVTAPHEESLVLLPFANQGALRGDYGVFMRYRRPTAASATKL
jgi:hypothetical protein